MDWYGTAHKTGRDTACGDILASHLVLSQEELGLQVPSLSQDLLLVIMLFLQLDLYLLELKMHTQQYYYYIKGKTNNVK